MQSKCVSCSRIFAGDWRAIFRSGVLDCDLTAYHWQWVTLTAPSFGKVNSSGTAANLDNYDYDGAVRWNLHLGALWDRTRLSLRRRFPGLDFAVVREWQRRGSLHIHALLRVPIDEATCDDELLSLVSGVQAQCADFGTGELFQMRWGRQMKVDTVVPSGSNAESIARQLWYLSKALNYAAKDLGSLVPSSGEHFSRLATAARRLKCNRCGAFGSLFCRSKVHRNFGARSHVLSVSRPTPTTAARSLIRRNRVFRLRRGWSLTGLTRKGQREARRIFALGLPNRPQRVQPGVLAAQVLALATSTVPTG